MTLLALLALKLGCTNKDADHLLFINSYEKRPPTHLYKPAPLES